LTSEQLSPNMTEDHLDAVFDALPKEMSSGELCALTLAVYSTYLEDTGEIMTELVSTIYTLGISSGISRESVSEGLRRIADMYDEETARKTAH
jgi:hypothetical protein